MSDGFFITQPKYGPDKEYRYFKYRHYLDDRYEVRVKIKKYFAIIPRRVDGKLIWFKYYFALLRLSAFRFGDRTLISYPVFKRSNSIFRFRGALKSEGVIQNALAQKREEADRREHYKRFFGGH